MTKFCFIFLDSTNRMPYIWKYIRAENYTYDIVLWDRSELNDDCGADVCYRLKHKINKTGLAGQIEKLLGYIKFSMLAKSVLRKNRYAGVFVFTPNSGLLVYRILMKNYRNRYILDIRDFWMEDKKWFQRIERKLIDNSYCTVISSEAYKRFLPKHEYILTHNSQVLDAGDVEHFRRRQLRKNQRIILACIGGIKHIEYDKKVIDYFSNDNRFELRYIGRGYDQLQAYCNKRGINNVLCEGTFPMEETLSKYEGVDFVMNMYGNHDKYLDYALSNKLYFAAQLGMPIVVCPDTYMSEISEKYYFGLSIDIEKQSDKNKLVEYYQNLNKSELLRNCDFFLKKVNEDEEEFTKTISAFVIEQINKQ